jgi:dihydrofolate reductase
MISIIAAMGRNRVIGRDNRLPWHLPADLAHFKSVTSGHAVILGRRNHESIGRPLPNRQNIVVTRQAGYTAPGCTVASDLCRALALASHDDEIFIIGGADIYRQMLPHADRIYLTIVEANPDGNVRFPAFDLGQWRVSESRWQATDERNAYAMTFQVLQRRVTPS